MRAADCSRTGTGDDRCGEHHDDVVAVRDGQRWVADVGKRDYALQPFGAGEQRWLRVQAGEVVLTLDYGRGCASDLAERAFQTLRGLLPDTDIYVLPAS